MAGILNYAWILLLALYIISPLDAHPLFLDDLIAAGIMFYMIYKNSRMKKHYGQSSGQAGSRNRSEYTAHRESDRHMTLDRAFQVLGVNSSDSLETISRAYREKMSKSHPDKVSHLSDELQEKARELTLQLNEAYNVIKQYRA